MSQPFQEGKTYRNRVGEYEVQAIDGDELTIRYVSGTTLDTKASLQSRIWENIQFEEQMAREEERRLLAKQAALAARKRSARAKKAKAKPMFQGFQESDFEPKKRGLAWSTREEMGRSVAVELGKRTGEEFGQWIVPRKQAVHIGRVGHYERGTRERQSAFFVATDEQGVTFGFRVGNPGGKGQADWPITSFFATIAEDGKPRRELRAAMKKYELYLDVYATDVSYGQVAQVFWRPRGFLWQHETADQEMTRKMNWPDVVEYLQTVSPDKQSDIVLLKKFDPDYALKAGKDLVGEMATIFEDLLIVYNPTVGA
jgi:hypothetical protein